jgi:hypothetical protein
MYRKNVEIEMLKIVKLLKHHETLHICIYIQTKYHFMNKRKSGKRFTKNNITKPCICIYTYILIRIYVSII